MRKIGNLMMVLGLAAFVVATAWWYAFFQDILGAEFQIARECFYWTTELCSLKSPAGLFSDVPVYDPALLWAAVGLFALGVLIRIPAR